MVIGTAATNSSVELFVRDTGPGLSVEARAHLFDPFFTTKEHGLGMGLAIVRTLVEHNGGSIVAENIADGGAIFRLILPAAVQSPSVPGGLSVEREVLAPLREHALKPRPAIAGKDARTLACDIPAMTDEDFRITFNGSPMRRAKLRGLKRNATVVLENVAPGV